MKKSVSKKSMASFEKADKAYDKVSGMKEDSPADKAMDAKGGLSAKLSPAQKMRAKLVKKGLLSKNV